MLLNSSLISGPRMRDELCMGTILFSLIQYIPFEEDMFIQKLNHDWLILTVYMMLLVSREL